MKTQNVIGELKACPTARQAYLEAQKFLAVLKTERTTKHLMEDTYKLCKSIYTSQFTIYDL